VWFDRPFFWGTTRPLCGGGSVGGCSWILGGELQDRCARLRFSLSLLGRGQSNGWGFGVAVRSSPS